MSPKRNSGVRRLRRGRCALENHIYHVTTVTADRQPLFLELAAGRLVVRSLMRVQESSHARTLAYVVMPDHLHWLMQINKDGILSSTVGSMKSQCSRLIRQLGVTKGPVWKRGYYDRALRRDDDLVQVGRYIVANPLRAGLVRDVGDYPLWDSVWV